MATPARRRQLSADQSYIVQMPKRCCINCAQPYVLCGRLVCRVRLCRVDDCGLCDEWEASDGH